MNLLTVCAVDVIAAGRARQADQTQQTDEAPANTPLHRRRLVRHQSTGRITSLAHRRPVRRRHMMAGGPGRAACGARSTGQVPAGHCDVTAPPAAAAAEHTALVPAEFHRTPLTNDTICRVCGSTSD